MESVHHDLALIVQLQRIYDRIATAMRERQSPPTEVQQLEDETRLRHEELDALEAQVGKRSEELREVRTKEEEWKLELEHFQRQKGMVTNEREFTAVISEIDYATKALNEATARRVELEGAIDELSKDIESRRHARPQEEATRKDVVESWERRKEELRQLIHDLAQEAARKEADVNPKHRARFLRLLESKKGTAVAALVDGSCSVCHFSVRPHLQQRVRRCQEIITCEHCHRILYLESIVEPSNPEVNAG